MITVYQSSNYDPDNVTGRYVRLVRKGVFRVFETVTGKRGPGMGPTIREYDTDGSELPEELRLRCIASRMTEVWG